MWWVKTVVKSTINALNTVKVTFLKSLQFYFATEDRGTLITSNPQGSATFPSNFFWSVHSETSSHRWRTQCSFCIWIFCSVSGQKLLSHKQVSSALLHRNCMILPVEAPSIYISSRPGWWSARSTMKTLSLQQIAHNSNSKCEEILRCLPHFLQNGEGI